MAVLPPLTLSLQFACNKELATRHRPALPRYKVARWIRHALAAEGEITVRIVNSDEGQRLNREFRAKDYATNVLTFDYQKTPIVIADLVLCAPVVEREACAQNKSLQSHYAHLLIHGVLHAQGWNHETNEQEAEAMEARESIIMQTLGFANPYSESNPPCAT